MPAVQGVLLKPLFSRGSHVFEAPILLSQTPADARALAAAALLPPLVSAGLHYLVLRPLRKRLRVQQVPRFRLQIPGIRVVICRGKTPLGAQAPWSWTRSQP